MHQGMPRLNLSINSPGAPAASFLGWAKPPGANATGGVPANETHRCHPEERSCGRLEGWPHALVAISSRLAVKDGERLRMTEAVWLVGTAHERLCPPDG